MSTTLNPASTGGASDAARWSPSPFLRISLWLHLGCALILVVDHAFWPWAIAVLVADNLVLVAAGMWPRSSLLGPNMVRLPGAAVRRREVALTFDDGPDPEVTPQVLDVLDRYGAKASFFCVGERAAAHPDIVRDIVRRGHSVENHSRVHSNAFAFYGLGKLRRELDAAQAIIGGITGRAPAFFRAPMGLRNPMLAPVVAHTGLRYVSWTRRGYDAVCGDESAVLRRLTRGLAAGDILLLHDRSAARTRAGQPVALAVLPALLEQLSAGGLRAVSLPAACQDGTL